VTGRVETYAAGAKKIHFEIDPSEVNKNVHVDLALIGDLKETLAQLLPHVSTKDHADWIAHIDALRGDSAVRDIQRLPDTGHLYAAHVVNDLWRHTKGEALVVTDVGQHQMWTAQYYRHEKPYTFVSSGGLGTMGFALPAAIGAKIARPDAEVWAVAGDGGFQMTAAELSTAAQEGVKVNIAILNNGYLGMVRQWQEFFYDKRYAATPMKSPDFVKLAEAHRLTGLRVTKRADVQTAIEKARETEGTVVIDFRVEKEDSVYPMVPAGADLADMIRRPKHSAIVETSQDE
jgi:acetolactate synthase-1/2/3 large subunit